jgi:hypothetical protein
MKNLVVFVLVLAVIFSLPAGAVELDKKNLKGLNYVRIQCEFNGVPYYKGYKSPKDQDLEEFNAEEVEARLKETGIPLTRAYARAVYDRMEARLSDAGVQIVEIRSRDEKNDSTILPTITIAVEVLDVSKERYFVLIYLTVSRWISTWSGTQNINTPVITWWQKSMLAAAAEELNKSIEKAVKTLTDDFLVKLKRENREEKKKEGPESPEKT